MSLQSYLESLRAKPEHVRRRYSFWTSLGLTAVIFVFWLGSFSSLRGKTETVVAAAVEKAGTPGGSLVASVGSFATDIKDIIFGPKKVTFSTVEVRAGKR